MKIPLYSQLKLKLESKGLDSTTSGQIAWFVCSMPLFCILFVSYNQFTFALIALSIYIINLLYIHNMLALVAVVISYCLAINYSNFDIFLIISVTFFVVCIIFKSYRIIISYCLGFLCLYISLQIFNALGGLMK